MPFIVGFITFLVLTFAGSAIVGPLTCNDGWQSPSIGKQGACSHHGGVNDLPKYLVMIVSVFGGVIVGSYYSGTQSRVHIPSDDSESSDDGDSFDREHIDVKDLITCPLCGSRMVERTARQGKYKGNKFFGCSQYPKCKGLINRDELDER
mgnify:CR=1 FL=1